MSQFVINTGAWPRAAALALLLLCPGWHGGKVHAVAAKTAPLPSESPEDAARRHERVARRRQGVAVVQYLDPLAPAAALALLKESERAGRDTQAVDAQHNGSTDLAAASGTAWAAQLRTEIHQRAECLLGQRVYVRCVASTAADLATLVADVREDAANFAALVVGN